jgi:hypothetical protein
MVFAGERSAAGGVTQTKKPLRIYLPVGQPASDLTYGLEAEM